MKLHLINDLVFQFNNKDFEYLIPGINSTPNLFLISVTVSFQPENNLSDSADIAGMNNISIAIKERIE